MCGATPQVRAVIREPFSIRYQDTSLQKERIYTPDFLVFLWSGTVAEVLVEVKRDEDRERYAPRQAAPHDAGQQWAEERPQRAFTVVTDRWMKRTGIDQFRLIHAHAMTSVDAAIAAQVVNEIEEYSWLTALAVCERLGAVTGQTWNRAMPMMLALIAAGQLCFDVRQALTLETPIHAGSIPCPFDDLFAHN